MIALERNRTKKKLHDKDRVHLDFTGKKRIAFNKELLTNEKNFLLDPTKVHDFKAARWKGAKERLFMESNNKCAYCEASTKIVSPGDVEHFRPKSKYWWLAYCYDNYLVSCSVCNSVFKGNKFPLLDETKALIPPAVLATMTEAEIDALTDLLNPDAFGVKGLSLADFTTAYHLERPLLLNPYFDNPADYFAWEVEDTLKHVILVPLKPEFKPYVEAAEVNYGLNRKELKELRYFHYDIYNTFFLTLADTSSRISAATQQRIENKIVELKDKSAPFAGMIRYFDFKNRGI
ncbi:HNH endonuclease [Emticicia agri]|uniref:HNH nuclease domain-containing protein n=1 Tax=Emticicia agri TaxID=2492393 RepID=A0A4Q5LTG2_9BACT|nr:hypothetical protein [Emticicia agri]RYU92703.1 hypothetical protein EWM59_25850 [Emticicia agri]